MAAISDITEVWRLEKLRRLELYQRLAGDVEAQAREIVKCQRSLTYWTNNYSWIYDPRAKTILPFMPWDHQWTIMKLFLGLDGLVDPAGEAWPLLIDKTRDLGGTAAIVNAMEWGWLFRHGEQFGLMSRTEAEVDDLTAMSLFGRIRQEIKAMPVWMRPPGFKKRKRHKTHDKKLALYNALTDSYIKGATTTADAFRSRRLSGLLIDEAAFFDKLEELLESVMDVTPSPCLLSSPHGREHFAAMIHGDAGVTVNRWRDGVGVVPRNRFGWVYFSLDVEMDPRKTPERQERAKALRPKASLRKEWFRDYDAKAGLPIFEQFERDRHLLDVDTFATYRRVIAEAQLWEGWDFGSGTALTIYVHAVYFKATDVLLFLDYHPFHRTHPKEVARQLGEDGYYTLFNARGKMPHYRVGDPSMTHPTPTQKSWKSYLKKYGVDLTWQKRSVEYTIHVMQEALEDGRMIFAPACAEVRVEGLPSLVECFEQHRRDTKAAQDNPREHKGKDPPPANDIYSHGIDAAAYIVDRVWPQHRGGVVKTGTQPRSHGYGSTRHFGASRPRP